MVVNFLQVLGVNKSLFENSISVESSYMNAEIRNLAGRPFNPSHLLGNAVSNIICTTLFGRRYEYDDSKFKELLRAVYRNVTIMGGKFGPLQMSRWAHILKWVIRPIRETEENAKLIANFIKEVLEEHRKDFKQDSPMNFIDVYLCEVSRKADVKNNEHNNNRSSSDGTSFDISVDDMCASASDLFLAGTETTATTLRWGILYMVALPTFQRRVQDELDAVVGRNRLPELSDKPDLPYTTATLLEMLRVRSILPLGIPHLVQRDTTLLGYDIPKGTVILPNMWSLTSKSDTWDDPDTFRPERFLDATGSNVINRDDFIPFSTGRRTCIGERLAQMEMFIFMTHLLHQFTLEKPKDSPTISFNGLAGTTLYPKPYEICALSRN